MSKSAPILELQNVVKEFGGHRAVDGSSTVVPDVALINTEFIPDPSGNLTRRH